MTLSAYDQNRRNLGQPITGTTTAAYVAVGTFYHGGGMTFLLQNNDASNNMLYKINIYNVESTDTITALEYPIKTETSIAGAASPVPVLDTSVDSPFYKCVIYVKDGTGGHAAFQIDPHKYLPEL